MMEKYSPSCMTCHTLRRDFMSKPHSTISHKKYIYLSTPCVSLWKDIALDPHISSWERSKIATWDYPADDTYSKV